MDTLKDISTFQATLKNKSPESSWPEALKAIWWDMKGNWEKAHNIAQDIPSDLGNWIHAYLHRKEGDKWNAGYWYRQAGKPFPDLTLDEEAQNIAEYIIRNPTA